MSMLMTPWNGLFIALTSLHVDVASIRQQPPGARITREG
jgi:hypothetical protein